jgi:hypothetical protein
MTRFKLVGAALALSALATTHAFAQVSEPAAVASQDPNFSIYSNYGSPGYGRALATQPYDANALAETRMSVKPHRAHRATVR